MQTSCVPDCSPAVAYSVAADEREVLPAMAMLYRASTMIGRHPAQEFVAVDAPPKTDD
jgi:hypothetical protein